MKIATWNVNSLPVRLAQVLDFLAQERPDVLALQETKTTDANFPRQALEDAGYHVEFRGQKSYNGVAVLARQPMRDARDALPGLDDPQRRLLAVSIGDLRVIDVYIPNGQSLDSDKFRYKCRWLDALSDLLREERSRHRKLVVLGDFNIAPTDLDMHDPVRWRGRIMCSPREQDWFQHCLRLGFVDGVRALAGDARVFSWWDYRMQAYRRGWGLRIDHVLHGAALRPVEYAIGLRWREQPRPSDHAPVILTLAEME